VLSGEATNTRARIHDLPHSGRAR